MAVSVRIYRSRPNVDIPAKQTTVELAQSTIHLVVRMAGRTREQQSFDKARE